jgi:hypothetical protein
LGMTREHYIEMCELLNKPVVESDIPVEYSDFPAEVQASLDVYTQLQDVWEPMSGTYMGKNLGTLETLMNLYEVLPQDRKFLMWTVQKVDKLRSAIYAEKSRQEASLKK